MTGSQGQTTLYGKDNPAFTHDVQEGPGGRKSDLNGVEKAAPIVPQYTKRQIIQNLLFISLGFLFNFTAFQALNNIQSSLNSDDGLGLASLSVIYAALIVSCMFVPAALIKRIGCKWTMPISMTMYSLYIAANFYAQWYTMIPTAILVGLGAAPLWSAKCTYVTEIGGQYAEIIGEKAEVLIVRFFGIFFMIFQTSQIWGNLISSLVLAPESSNNGTLNFTDFSICGADYCNEPLLGNDKKPAMSQVYMLCGIYLACSLVGVLILCVTVSPLKRVTTKQSQLTGLELMVATFKHMKNYKQLLLIPLTIYSGVEQSFITGDFTKAFVNCALGIHNVGYVMICLGVVDALFSLASGPLIKIVGRIPLYTFGALINVSLAIAMLSWRPTADSPVAFYAIAGLWGMADAIWQTQINALYGVLFSEHSEAGFSNYRLWESLGFIIGFAWSNFLCVNVKIYILLTILCLGMLGYYAIEVIDYMKRNKTLRSV